MASINEADNETLEAIAEELITEYCGQAKCKHCNGTYIRIFDRLKEAYVMGQCST